MRTRILSIPMAVVFVFLLACQNKEKPPAQTSSEKPTLAPDTSAADTARADSTQAERLLAKGFQFAVRGRLDSAIIYFEKAGITAEAQKEWATCVQSYNFLGEACWKKGDLAGGVAHLDHAKAIGSRYLSEQTAEMAYNYYNLGNVHHIKGEFDEAMTALNKALNIHSSASWEKPYDLTKIYNSLGMTYGDRGDWDRALAFFQAGLETVQKNFGEKSHRLAEYYNNIGILHQRKGDYERALVFYEKALALNMELLGENHLQTGFFYRNIGEAYIAKKEYDQALVCLTRAKKILESTVGETHTEVAQVYVDIGIVYAEKKDFALAIPNHEKALSIYQAVLGKQHYALAEEYHNLAEIYLATGKTDRVIDLHKKALQLRLNTFGKYHERIAESYNVIAKAYARRGDDEQALAYYRQAIAANSKHFMASAPPLNSPADTALSEINLFDSLQGKAEALWHRYAHVSRSRPDLESAVATFQLASQLVDRIRAGYKTEGAKLFLAGKTQNLFDQAIQAAIAYHRLTRESDHFYEAFQFAEKSRAGVLLTALSEAEAQQFAGIPDSLLEKEKQLKIDLAFYDEILSAEQLKGENGDQAKIARWQGKFFDFKQAYDALLQSFEKEYPDYYNLKYQVKIASVPEVRQLLDEQAALVEYFTGADSIFIFAVTPKSFALTSVAKDSTFEQNLEQLREGIITQDFAKYAPPAHRLYQLLLAPIADKLKEKNLILIPDGALSGIPFEALLTEQVAEGKSQDYAKLPYLVNDHTISYAYSATLLQQEAQKKNRKTPRDYLAFAPVFANGLPAGTRGGDFFKENFKTDSSKTATAPATAAATRLRGYLPSTKKEVTEILDHFKDSYNFFERWFGNKSNVYLEREANETTLKAGALGDYRILHFATHGLVNEKNPKLSGLILAPEDSTSKEDGILHLSEIYNLNLNADLVVLSACETGLGQVAKGEGIIGLTRGFLYAGASNLLVSLWQVSDATTADLMVDFYDKMLGGMNKPEALREAKLQMIRRHPEYAKPYYWAPFILVGR